jgi:hypothetical protein
MSVAGHFRGTSGTRSFNEDIALNHATVELHGQFEVAIFQKKEHPTTEQVAANKLKWGLDP